MPGQRKLTLEAETLVEGAGDSWRIEADNVADDAPLLATLGTGACLKLGDAILCDLVEGLMEPAAGAGWGWAMGLRGGKVDVEGDA